MIAVLGAGCMSGSPTQPVVTPDLEPTEQPSTGKIAAREVQQTGCAPKALTIQNLMPNTAISLPLTFQVTVENSAHPTCRWTLFEAQAGHVELRTFDGEVLASAPLATTEDWMTDAAVSFETKLESTTVLSPGSYDIVIIEEDPSGEKTPQTVTIPVFVPGDRI